ncbi:MAG: DNA-binding response regulator [Chloroflexi bacterium HGW-Chloroflexi-8]|jgi:DNA-binding NarL/FixJ family response regulator|nr:MAG: DNA-binding response regulator [Chloroflexi bacterium HGW-Chloroflexi-8]
MSNDNEQMKPMIRVVLADDHAVVRAGIRQFLEQAGDIDVIAEASDGAMAIEMIGRMAPDVAILDIQMPKATGIEVSREIRAHRWPIGVLILTSYDDDPYISAVLKTGANGYVLKTASPDEIINAVRDVYQGKSVLDAEILPKVLAKIANPTPAPFYEPLTDREIEILSLVARGLTNKVVGIKLKISDRTVQGHIARIFEKLLADSRTEAVMRGISLGLIQLPEEIYDNDTNFEI